MSTLPALLSALALMQLAPMTEAGQAARAEEEARLAACLDLIETDPEAAYEDGLAWLGAGGRPGARQCTAVALIALGHPEQGAARLEELANAPDAGDLEDRVNFLAQAGNAWLLAGAHEAALTTLSNALRLSPDSTELMKDRAVALLSLERWPSAVEDLDRVLTADPLDAESLGLRARAHLNLENFEAALIDVETARQSLPADIELLVLRGDIREAARLAGR